MSKLNLTIITPSNNPKNLERFLYHMQNQIIADITYEHIIVQESNDGFNLFNLVSSPLLSRAKVLRSKINNDYGAISRDLALKYATGEFILFWDDDNLYFPHAMLTQYLISKDSDIGISKVHHQGMVIPARNKISPGDIDTMNICVSRKLAIKASWNNNGTKYSDYIYLSKLLIHDPVIRYSDIIIGHHL